MPDKNIIATNSATPLYGVTDLVVLEGLEAVRLRPGMYIGTTGAKGLHHILWEIVDNSMDEAANGYADTIEVIVYEDGSVSVEDNGRGIPIEIHPKYKISGIEMVYTKLHAGGKFDNKEYKFSGGLHGVGASVTNALSKWLKVQVFREKKEYVQEFHSFKDGKNVKSGVPKGPIQCVGQSKKRGTKTTFLPDNDVFEGVTLDRQTIKRRIRELAYLNKGIRLIFEDRREKNEEGDFYRYDYCFKGGISDFVKHLNETKNRLFEKVIYISGGSENFELELAIQYNDTPVETIISYVNNIPTSEGGTHETGFKQAYTKCLNDYVKRNNLLKAKDPQLIGDDFREGMTAVLSIRMQNIQFEGQTKTKLGNPEVKGIVESIINEKLPEFFEDSKNKDLPSIISKVGINAGKIRDAEKKTKDAMRAKNSMSGQALAGKFSACSGKNPLLNELFIVEGESAGGSARKGRDRNFQAVLPLRGKPLNTETAKKHELLSNEEIKTLIYAIGADFDKDFNIDNLKYDKIIILADADHDGEHIRSLLLTFFYRHMRQLISEGHVYFGMPPLYKVEKRGVIQYAYDDQELDKILEDNKGKEKFKLQRYKGLGEMSDVQLWDTTLNPKTRTLMRITVDDVAEADRMLSTWMGNDALARKEYINENANFNKIDKFAEKIGG
ncbi:MAG: DNA topoisomerase 4 subunit B [Firmicutes bacterium ADurb.Bin080]|jgi:DNA gyrase subunit B|nr:DNA gyrase subunit B [Clostridiales bacterium]OQC14521.1 MAG: DNA topoisomerase 4 subunit B [Firmicutes bacterium ADurb.Bin080]